MSRSLSGPSFELIPSLAGSGMRISQSFLAFASTPAFRSTLPLQLRASVFASSSERYPSQTTGDGGVLLLGTCWIDCSSLPPLSHDKAHSSLQLPTRRPSIQGHRSLAHRTRRRQP